MRRWKERSLIRYSTPTLKLLLLSVGALGLSGVIKLVDYILNVLRNTFEFSGHMDLSMYIRIMIIIAAFATVVLIVERVARSDIRQIRYMVIRRLCKYKYGNPLRLQDGEIEPKVKVKEQGRGYRVRVSCPSVEFEKVASLESVISDCLTGKYAGFAVIAKDEDVANRYVDYFIDNEADNVDRQNIYNSLEDMRK